MPDQRDWDAIRALARELTDPVQPFLSDEVRALIRTTAQDVAISPTDTASALTDDASAAALVKEIAGRLSNGSRRLSRTITELRERRSAGDLDGARQLLKEVLAVEVVPHYQDIVHAYLEALEDEP